MAENTRELKRRMRSIESTEHITNAMRLVSAAKFRKAKSLFDQKSLQLREVTETMELLFGRTKCLRARETLRGGVLRGSGARARDCNLR